MENQKKTHKPDESTSTIEAVYTKEVIHRTVDVSHSYSARIELNDKSAQVNLRGDLEVINEIVELIDNYLNNKNIITGE